FCLHIVAIILQVIVKIQVISERENRAAFLRSLSLRRKGHPSGGIHAPWYLPSEIAVASFCSVYSALSVLIPIRFFSLLCLLRVSALIILFSGLIPFPPFPRVILSPSMETDIQYMQEAL